MKVTRASFAISLMLAFVMLVPASAGAAAKPGAACNRAKGQTVARNAEYRIYQRSSRHSARDYSWVHRVFACSMKSTHLRQKRLARWVNDQDGESTVNDATFAGRYALIDAETETGVVDAEWLLVADLKTARSRSIDWPQDDQGIGDRGLSRKGTAFAVLAPASATNRALHAFDKAGDHVVATGDFSEPALAGNTVYWIQGGTLHAFSLAGAYTDGTD